MSAGTPFRHQKKSGVASESAIFKHAENVYLMQQREDLNSGSLNKVATNIQGIE